jgi:hypothetical protein
LTGPRLLLDHLVVGAESLEAGVEHLRRCLGVDLPFGGRHPRMGTHNCLMRIGDGAFLEIIAIDPDLDPPPRPRWFALDNADQRSRLAKSPALIAWLAGTRDIGSMPSDLGVPVEMTRGDLTWLIGIRDDGELPEGGVLPCLIQWPDGPHPSDRMADLGIRLRRLRLAHPDPLRIRDRLAALGAGDLAEVVTAPAPSLEADLLTPDGRLVTLR